VAKHEYCKIVIICIQEIAGPKTISVLRGRNDNVNENFVWVLLG